MQKIDNKQMVFDTESMNAQFKTVVEGRTFEATIREITQMKASEIFGQDCDNPDREVIHLTVEITDGETFYETYSLPKSIGSWQRENFRLGAFAKRYGSVPYVGQKVQAVVNDKNWPRILA